MRLHKCSGGSVTIHSELLVQVWGVPAEMKPVVMICNLELGQQPSRECVVAHRLSQVLSQGRSTGYGSHRAHFKKPKHRNNSAGTRQLQKNLQTGGHRPEWFLTCFGRVNKPRSAWLSCNTSALILAPSVQSTTGASCAVISHHWSSSKSCHKFSL